MRTIIIMKGLPAAGKSTFARDLLNREPKRWKRVNRDDLRSMLDEGVYSKQNEDFVRSVQDQLVLSALNDGFDVIIDNTNLIPSTLRKIHQLAEGVGDVKVIEQAFNVSIAECMKRNSAREGKARVPDKVITDMAKASGIDRGKCIPHKEVYYPPRVVGNVITQDESLPKIVMCDLDGTLALIGDRSPYDASKCDVLDKPNIPVIETLRAMHKQKVKIVFMSGRDSKYREQSVRFIEQWCRIPNTYIYPSEQPRPETDPIPYTLFMRGEGDMRKDSIIKRELFDEHIAGKFNVLFVLDDRNQVVDTWRSMGLTCFQVADGNF